VNQKTSSRIRRRECPPVMQGRTGYRNAVPYLRRDFDFRCAYCGIHEQMKGGPKPFALTISNQEAEADLLMTTPIFIGFAFRAI